MYLKREATSQRLCENYVENCGKLLGVCVIIVVWQHRSIFPVVMMNTAASWAILLIL